MPSPLPQPRTRAKSERRVPPLARGAGSIAAPALNGLPDTCPHLCDEPVAIEESVGVTPKPDPAPLLLGSRTVPSEVQPQEQAIGNVADPRARASHVEVD